MLLQVAAEIEAELAQGDDPDDDPDDPGPQGPGGRRAARERPGPGERHHARTSALPAAAGVAHIPYNNPSGAAPP